MNDKDYMKMAIDLAKKARGNVSPNPLVGAIIVKNGKIIAKGYHKEYGKNHAEKEAILLAKESLEGANLYCNLEPCSHKGKQEPCLDLILEKKIKKVFIANLDPNPKVSSIKRLKDEGVEVNIGLCEKEGQRLNEIFFYHIKEKKPFVALKYAVSMDGKIASSRNDSKWISNEKSRKYVHKLRNTYDSILIGKNTAQTDDPSLTCRIKNGRNPIRIILDSNFTIDSELKIFKNNFDNKTYIATCSDKKRDDINAKIIRCKENKGKVDLNDLLEKLYQEKICSILVEGGSIINNSFLEEGLVNKIYQFISPIVLSGKNSKSAFYGRGVSYVKDAYKFDIVKIKKFDDNLMIEANNVYRNS